ncbi:MAG: hypothetical protein CM15mP12_0400 [Gammaproteobacteria bacterium]|nr:MAG: hypothetical protein CM15mP12_0400 [Gammaproteobacteria bacterium]
MIFIGINERPESEFECDVQIRYKSLPVRSSEEATTGYKISFKNHNLQ